MPTHVFPTSNPKQTNLPNYNHYPLRMAHKISDSLKDWYHHYYILHPIINDVARIDTLIHTDELILVHVQLRKVQMQSLGKK
jgi:hypothetical protein